jgi:outer membrane receptor protein involved in Fe transport
MCGVATACLVAGTTIPVAVHAQDQSSTVNERIVVTATRREQAVQDVTSSISVLSPQEIDERGVNSMNEYTQGQPSVRFQGGTTSGRNKVIIRGVSGDGETREERTSGVYFGEAPISALGERGFSDPKLVDIDRVEVLRGPQGTLYGAGAMGGALRIIPASPDLSELGGFVGASVSGTAHGEASTEVSAAVNVPLVEDMLAVRAVGYNYEIGGFIDNNYPGNAFFGAAPRSEEDANDEDTTGGRVAVLFEPSPEFSATLTYLRQDTQTGGISDVQPAIASDLSQVRGGKEGFEDSFEMFNLTASYDFGAVELVSATTDATKDDSEIFDIREFLAPFGFAPGSLRNETDTEFFAQELRLVSSDDDSPLFWVVGGYHSEKELKPIRRFDWYGDAGGFATFGAFVNLFLGFPVADEDDVYTYDATFEETQNAIFADATYSFDNGFSIAGGLRWASYDYSRAEVQDGAFAGGFQAPPPEELSEDVYLPRANVSYEPDDDSLYYLQAAKGFRVGRVNLRMPDTCIPDLAPLGLTPATVPGRANSDSLWSYEAGTKQTFGDGRFTANFAAYYIDWSDIQVQFLGAACGFEFFSNAGKASNRGAEFEFVGEVTDNLTLGLATSYNDAHLDEDAPLASGSNGEKGDRLPGTPRWIVNASARYGWDVDIGAAFIRGNYIYNSDIYSDFDRNNRSGDYGVVNVSTGVDTDEWEFQVFADNLFDERGLPTNLTGDFGSFPLSPRFTIERPRTIGLRLTVRR